MQIGRWHIWLIVCYSFIHITLFFFTVIKAREEIEAKIEEEVKGRILITE